MRPGIVALTLGTSGVVFATTERPLVEPEGRLHAFCHALPARWHFMGVTLAAAGSLQWYRDTLLPGVSFDDVLREAEAAPAGCEGLLFLPYLSGERTPHPDPLARGAFVGLTVRHGRAHMTRAMLEGVAFSMRDCLALLAGVGASAWSSVEAACDATIAVTGRDAPDPAWAAAYGALHARYRELYPALKPTFERLGT